MTVCCRSKELCYALVLWNNLVQDYTQISALIPSIFTEIVFKQSPYYTVRRIPKKLVHITLVEINTL